MDKSLAGLIGAVGALTAIAPANAMPASQAPTQDSMQVRSYSDLLKPIPNALELLQAQEGSGEAKLELAQVIIGRPPHHHHHHAHYRRRVYHHHHHHHHHRGPAIVIR